MHDKSYEGLQLATFWRPPLNGVGAKPWWNSTKHVQPLGSGSHTQCSGQVLKTKVRSMTAFGWSWKGHEKVCSGMRTQDLHLPNTQRQWQPWGPEAYATQQRAGRLTSCLRCLQASGLGQPQDFPPVPEDLSNHTRPPPTPTPTTPKKKTPPPPARAAAAAKKCVWNLEFFSIILLEWHFLLTELVCVWLQNWMHPADGPLFAQKNSKGASR